MNLYTIYFSPTGGTKAVVEQLAKEWNKPLQEIDLSSRHLDFSAFALTKQDVCLIAVPSFGGRVPEIALRHLSAIQGGGAQAVLIVSYGNRAYDDTLLELQDAANACGFRVIGAVAAATEHSIMRQYGTARPDAQDLDELTVFSQTLVKKTAHAKAAAAPILPGDRPFRAYDGVPLKPKASKHCIRCGLCAANCPVAAIPEEDPSQTKDTVCISCMRCVQICPVRARANAAPILEAAGEQLKEVCAGRKPNQLFVADE